MRMSLALSCLFAVAISVHGRRVPVGAHLSHAALPSRDVFLTRGAGSAGVRASAPAAYSRSVGAGRLSRDALPPHFGRTVAVAAMSHKLCGKFRGNGCAHLLGSKTKPKTASSGLGSLWASSGAGPVLANTWGRLAVFPPLSWVNWLAVKLSGAPAFYRYYIYYTLGNSLAKRLFPGIHAQLTTGTSLGLLKAVSPEKYADNVAVRLQNLLVRQARLRARPGQPAPTLSAEALEAATAQLKSDQVLLDALGATSALAVWHKFEKTPLDDPRLLEEIKSSSQARWVLEALRAGYLGDVEAAVRKRELYEASGKASQTLRTLSQAVDAAILARKAGILENGGGGAIAEVEKASAAAAEAAEALERARAREPEVAANEQAGWEAKIRDLSATHATSPAVSAELGRLLN